MINLSLVVGISGVLLAFVGIVFSYISYQKTKDFERRLEEKERIKKLTKKLSDLIKVIQIRYIVPIKSPLSAGYDTITDLEYCGKHILSMAFDTKKPAVDVVIDLTMWGIDREDKGGKHKNINSIEDYNNNIKTFKQPVLEISYKHGNNIRSDLYLTYILFNDIDYIIKNFEDLVNDFAPNLLGELTNTLEKILAGIVESATQNKIINVDVVFEEPNSTIDLGMYVYTKAIATDEVKRDVNELEKLVDRLDKARSDLLTTAYA